MNPSQNLRVAALLSCLLGATSASAAVTQVAARGDVVWNDAVEWTSAGAEYDAVPDGTVAGSLGGASVKVGLPAGAFDGVRLDQDSGWAGGFGAGQALLYTDVQDVWLDLSFSSPVFAAGLELQPDFLFVSAFNAQIEAFDSGGVSLGSFVGVSASSSPLFLGVESGLAEIGRIRLSITSVTDADPLDGIDPFPGFAVNRLDFLKERHIGVPDGGSTLVWMSLAGLGMVVIRSRGGATRR